MYDGSLSVITENFTQAGRFVSYNVQHNLNKNDVWGMQSYAILQLVKK